MQLEEPDYNMAPNDFIINIANSQPQIAEKLNSILEDYETNPQRAEEIFTEIVNLFKEDLTILHQFNEFLNKERKVAIITKSIIKNMVNFLMGSLSKRVADQALMSSFIKISIDVSKNHLDNKAFFSIDELTSHFLSKVKEFDEQSKELGEDFHKILQDILIEFKLKEEASMNAQNEAIKQDKHIAPAPVTKPVKTIDPLPKPPTPAYEPKTVYNIKTETDIIDILSEMLSEKDFEFFNKLLFLYGSSVISYNEFVQMGKNILSTLKKDVCLTIKTMLENREKLRIKVNPFFIKNHISAEEPELYNKSYKKLEPTKLMFDRESVNDLINKRFICMAHGTESTATTEEGNTKRFVKNSSEGLLLKVEDEMHEFDIMIHQIEVFGRYLDYMHDPELPESKYRNYFKKIRNLHIIKHIYGSNSEMITGLIEQKNLEAIERLRDRFKLYNKKLHTIRKQILPNWKMRMHNNYYRSLDILSNTIKMMEKRLLEGKVLLDDVKHNRFRRKVGKLRIWSSIKRLLYYKKETYVNIEKNSNWFYNPIFFFSLPNKAVMKDVINILRLHLQTSKNNYLDKTKNLSIIKTLFEDFFDVKGDPGVDLIGEMPTAESLTADLKVIEEKLLGERKFSNIDKFVVKVENCKSPEKMNNLIKRAPIIDDNEGEDNDSVNGGSEFEKIINSNSSSEEKFPKMRINKQQTDPKKRNLFGPHQFYLLYQYFFFICERFNFAYEFSAQKLKDESLYYLFKKLLTYYLIGMIDSHVYEECMKTLLGDNAGIFLNLDKMMNNLLKVNFTNDFTSFTLELSKNICESDVGDDNSVDEANFAKICFRMVTKAVGTRTNRNTAVNLIQNYSSLHKELFRFELDRDKYQIFIHKIKSIYQEDGKNANNTHKKLVTKISAQLNQNRNLNNDEIKDHYWSNSKVSLSYSLKRKDFIFNKPGLEDIVLRNKVKTVEEEQAIVSKKDSFRQKREFIFRKMRE